MGSEEKKFLLTGWPGCGKTTTIMKIISGLPYLKPAGFVTSEIRENKVRKGFRWIRLDGTEGILAHVDIRGPYRVGKYGVDVPDFEENVVPVLDMKHNHADLFVVDEIGKMECLSEKFVRAVRTLFTSDRAVLATVAQKGSGLIQEVKNQPQSDIFHLSPENRNQIATEIIQILKKIFK